MRRLAPLLLVAAVGLTVLAGAAWAGGAAAWPRTMALADGSTVVVAKDGHVVHRDAKGQPEEESWCESGAAWVRRVQLFSAFRAAVLKGDRTRATALVAYPLGWNHGGRHDTLASAAALANAWPRVFTPGVLAALRGADPQALFCKNGSQFTAGVGAVWGQETGGRPRIFSVSSF